MASCRFSSSIFTKPPSGRRPRQYSVSRPCRRSTLGPKPMENVRTFTPKTFANTKCPSSCTKISTEQSSAKYSRSTRRLYHDRGAAMLAASKARRPHEHRDDEGRVRDEAEQEGERGAGGTGWHG